MVLFIFYFTFFWRSVTAVAIELDHLCGVENIYSAHVKENDRTPQYVFMVRHTQEAVRAVPNKQTKNTIREVFSSLFADRGPRPAGRGPRPAGRVTGC